MHLHRPYPAIALGKVDTGVIRQGGLRTGTLITGEEKLSSLRSVLEKLMNRNGDLKIAIIP